MIYNWNEVSQPMFKEIFDTFWDGKHPDKILEIQNLTSIYSKIPNIRIFFGEKINITDWKAFNEDTYSILKMIGGGNLETLQKETKLSMCITEGGPKVTPLGAAPEHYDIIMKTCFGFPGDYEGVSIVKSMKPMSTWFIKSSEEKYCCNLAAEPNISPEEMIFRIRAIDFEDWKREITRQTTTGYFSEELTKDDVPRENIDVKFPEIR